MATQEVYAQPFPTAATIHSVDLPAVVNDGELLLIHFAAGATNQSFSVPSGYTEITGFSDRCITVAKVGASSDSGGSVTFPLSISNVAVAIVYRISGWFGDLSGIEAVTASSSGSTLPSLTTSWSGGDTLWLGTIAAADDDATVVSFPSGYVNTVSSVSGGGVNNGQTAASCEREDTSQTNEAGSYLLSEQEIRFTGVIAIRLLSDPSLTAPATVSPGATISVTPSNFVDPPTGARITDGTNIIEITHEDVNDTVTPPALATQSYVLFGNVTLELYNATESATTTVAFNPPASHQYLVTLPATPSNLTDTGYLFNWNPTNGYEGAQVIATVPIDENGNILETAVTGEQTFYSIDDFDGAMQSFPVTIQDGQIVNVGRITRRNLTRRALTRRSLTARP